MTDLHNQFSKAWEAHQAGKIEQARQGYLAVLDKDEGHVDSRHLLGLLLQEQGDTTGALAHLEVAAALAPDSEVALTNFATVLLTAGRADEARIHLDAALKLEREYVPAHYNLACLFEQLGNEDQALFHYRQVLLLNPEHPRAHNNIAGVLRSRGEHEASIDHYAKALLTTDDSASVHSNLGDLFKTLGRADEAVTQYLRALKINPDFLACRHQFVSVLEYVTDPKTIDGLLEEADRCCQHAGINKQDLGVFLIGVIADDVDCRRVIEQVLENSQEEINKLWTSGDLHEFATNRWIGHLLEQTYLSYPVLEDCLVKIRRAIFEDHRHQPDKARAGADDASLAFVCRIARHAFNGEHIFEIAEDETSWLQELVEDIAARIAAGNIETRAGQCRLALYCMYEPLSGLGCADELLALNLDTVHPVLREVIVRDLIHRQEETDIAKNIRELTPIRNPIHERVQQMYEDNPFPRWLTLSRHARPRPAAKVLKHLFPHFEPSERLKMPVDILIAGSGTGQHALQVASRFSHSSMLAVDLSRRSLAYGIRQSVTLVRPPAVDFVHGDIAELGDLERTFDVIESIGVLHHMADPMVGWRLLTDRLNPGGVMKIGLYSELARQAVVVVRNLAESRGGVDTLGAMRSMRREILTSPDLNECRDVIRYGDFYNASTCRDLLFHVQEKRYTIHEIRECLTELGLRFIGWELMDLTSIDSYRRAYPDDSALNQLDNWQIFEEGHPRTFEQCYQFWCVKD